MQLAKNVEQRVENSLTALLEIIEALILQLFYSASFIAQDLVHAVFYDTLKHIICIIFELPSLERR